MNLYKQYNELLDEKRKDEETYIEARSNQDLFHAVEMKHKIDNDDLKITEFKRNHKIDCFDICNILKNADGQDWVLRVLREIKKDKQTTFYTGKYAICYAHKTEVEHLDTSNLSRFDVELEDWEFRRVMEGLRLLVAKTDNSQKSFEFHPLSRFSEQNFFDVALGKRNKVCNSDFIETIRPSLFATLVGNLEENANVASSSAVIA